MLALAMPLGQAEEYQIEDENRTAVFEVVSEPRLQVVGTDSPIVLYERGLARNEANRRIATREVLVELAAGESAAALAQALGVSVGAELAYAPGHYLFRAASSRAALALTATLRAQPGVLSANPLLGRMRHPRFVPTDPLFEDQWGIMNTGQNGALPGVDVNVTNVWESYRGRGIKVGIVDNGVKYTHPDLAANCDTTLDYDYYDNDDDARPAFDQGHGTSSAGIVGATAGNLIGCVGVAFESTLVGIRLLGGPLQTDAMDAASITHSNQLIQIYCNGWGPPDTGEVKGGAGTLLLRAFQDGATRGRGGKGSIFVWGSGNGAFRRDNSNYDTDANSIYVIAVGAVNDRGQVTHYSEPGSNVLLTAPGGRDDSSEVGGGPLPNNLRPQAITTVDLVGQEGFNNTSAFAEYADLAYTRRFAGTSASAPFVAGVTALMLEANPNLGWRDVQEVLLRSAMKNDPAHLDWLTNAAGFHFNHNYGAGLVNADAAVTLGKTWINLKPATSQVFRQQINPPVTIPNLDPVGVTREFDLRSTSLRVEHVTVTITANHPRRGDLSVRLISPAGTISKLAETHGDTNANYTAHKFMSVFNWGESSSGLWRVQVRDLQGVAATSQGDLALVELEVFGTPLEPLIAPQLTATRAPDQSVSLSIRGSAGRTYAVQASENLKDWQTMFRTNTPAAQFTVRDPLPAGAGVLFYRAQGLP